MVINILASLFCSVYLIMMCLGCGKGVFKYCTCLGINFEKEQDEAAQVQEAILAKKGQSKMELINRL